MKGWLLSLFGRTCPPCEQPHIEKYVTSGERQARLERLRAGAMVSWEDALVWGEGNYLTRVYAPMVVGAFDVVALAEELTEHPGNKSLHDRLQGRIKDFLLDVDTAKRSEQYDQERREAQVERERQAAATAADALAIARDNH